MSTAERVAAQASGVSVGNTAADRNITEPRVSLPAACHMSKSRASTHLCIGTARTFSDLVSLVSG
jgi:hypothetical protein